MKPHKWAKEIKAWADGVEIEFKYVGLDPFYVKEFKDWKPVAYPNWDDEYWEFQIKPQPKEPQYLYVYGLSSDVHFSFDFHCGLNSYQGKIKLEVDDDE